MSTRLDARIARLEATAAARPPNREAALRRLWELGVIPDENGEYCPLPPPDPDAKPCDPALRARVLARLRQLGCLNEDDPNAAT
ncbi:MAG TPA: hypothetical protein PK144_18200 [Plasticicumulans sp.]|nr:hypothetical protein [Plasticicumulans sp.]